MTSYPQNVINELNKINDVWMKIPDQSEHIGWDVWQIRKARQELGINYHKKPKKNCFKAQNKIKLLSWIEKGEI